MLKITEKDLKAWVTQRAHPKGKSVGDGLMFRVSPQGQATWALRYRFNGQQRYCPLGRYPAVSLEAARIAAKKAWAKVYAGVDVAREKHRERIEARGAISFSELAADYLQRTGKALVERSQDEVRRFLKKDLEPALGDLAARDIKPAHIVELVEKVGRRSDPVARRCFEGGRRQVSMCRRTATKPGGHARLEALAEDFPFPNAHGRGVLLQPPAV